MIRTECSQTILRSAYAYTVLNALSTGPTSIERVYSIGGNRSATWKALKTLIAAGLIQREAGVIRPSPTLSVENGRLFYTINPFDFRLDNVLSSRWITRILLILQENGPQYLRELNALIQRCAISSLQAALRPLVKERVVLSESHGNRRLLKLNSKLLSNPDDHVSNVPQLAFHPAIKELMEILQTEHHNFEAVLITGSVAHGLAQSPMCAIEVIGILPSNPSPDRYQLSLEGLARAASIASERTGASMVCAASTSDLFHQQMWGCFERPDRWLSGAVMGIPIVGKCKTANLATLFSEMSAVLPPSADQLHKWLKSGTIRELNGTYTFTLKGVNRLRRISPPPRHSTLRVQQRDIVLVTYSE